MSRLGSVLLVTSLACSVLVTPVWAQDTSLTLAEAIARVRSSSPLLKAALAQLDGSRVAARLTGRPPNPTVTAQFENLGHRSRTPAIDSIGTDVFVLLTQPLELWGKRSARRSLAALDSDLAHASVELVGRSLTLQTIERYVGVVRARDALDVLAATMDEFAALVENFELRVAAGFAPEADLVKFRTEAARLNLQLARVGVDLERDAAMLGALLGLDEPVDPSRLETPASLAPPDGDPLALAQAALADRPEIRAARLDLELARQGLALERARRYPDPAITGGYKRTAHEHTGVLGVSLAVPLFDRNGASVALATAAERVAASALAATERRALLETQALVVSARQLAARAAQAEDDVLIPAATVRSAAQTAFREGAADVLTLVDAERVYAAVRREILDLRLDAFLTAVQARLALGEEPIP